jgi:hypothetical protein
LPLIRGQAGLARWPFEQVHALTVQFRDALTVQVNGEWLNEGAPRAFSAPNFNALLFSAIFFLSLEILGKDSPSMGTTMTSQDDILTTA